MEYWLGRTPSLECYIISRFTVFRCSSFRSLAARTGRQNPSAAPVLPLALYRRENRERLECLPLSDRAPAETAAVGCCNCNLTPRCPTYSCISTKFLS